MLIMRSLVGTRITGCNKHLCCCCTLTDRLLFEKHLKVRCMDIKVRQGADVDKGLESVVICLDSDSFDNGTKCEPVLVFFSC